jgi:thiol-disulfide isomerase/thioredoxin
MKLLHFLVLSVLVFGDSVGAAPMPSPVAGPRVGNPAPAFEVTRWLAGPPIKSLAQGKVYVIDIWAPWCGPCVGGMPHLTDQQHRFGERGLVVIGLTGPDDYGTTLDSTKTFLTTQGSRIGYSIAWDEHKEKCCS